MDMKEISAMNFKQYSLVNMLYKHGGPVAITGVMGSNPTRTTSA